MIIYYTTKEGWVLLDFFPYYQPAIPTDRLDKQQNLYNSHYIGLRFHFYNIMKTGRLTSGPLGRVH